MIKPTLKFSTDFYDENYYSDFRVTKFIFIYEDYEAYKKWLVKLEELRALKPKTVSL